MQIYVQSHASWVCVCKCVCGRYSVCMCVCVCVCVGGGGGGGGGSIEMGLSVGSSIRSLGRPAVTLLCSSHFCSFRAFPGKLFRVLISNESLTRLTQIRWPSPAWLTFGHALLNYQLPPCLGLWTSSIRTFANKQLIGLNSNLLGHRVTFDNEG